ncbi:TonB-dependent receptor [Acinetobacter wanghuae]|uniref:TonB-dependent receptor n=1 Tax=Acinetobacter wanghuae TaxID=2662362 RepID=A0A5Q0P0W5_9GAMM|nr:zinc piracy TonB-dependent receptor ZnuD [Acinetobacter wanghuae]MQW90835.1 TonB-dependent receptor [Acinetobacter wanghuae]QGA10332.1 TonB-dependent receptor [Acinetobacter wanghuae]
MAFHKNFLAVSILAAATPQVWAEQNNNSVQTLETIQVIAHPLAQTAADFAVADQVIDQTKLSTGATTIGDALANELGVYSNQFGSGSSRPVIRGQDGPRVKVLQHASETADVSSLSPDHTVTVDPILAKQIEVIRGPSTLLYAAGTVGGLVNVTDQKIPNQMPEDGLEGSVGVRYNSGSDEKLASAGVTAGIGENFALRVEGSKRKANDYIAHAGYVVEEPHGDHSHFNKERRVDNTFAEGETINVGGSWIHDRGFVGASYSNRQDQYGLPGHSHGDEEHGHDEHEEAGAWIDLKSERYDVRTELYNPMAGFEKLRAHASFTDYKHAELEGAEALSYFKSEAYDARLELVHVPVLDWEGVIGLQLSQQKVKISGTGHEHEAEEEDHEHDLLMADNKTQKYSLFALEHKQMGDVHIELGVRADHQEIKIDSNQKNHSDTAFSGSAAVNWEFAPSYKLSMVGSHQQRLPIAQELYAQGKHHATQTIEHGNDQLDLEKSNNIELGLHYEGDKLDYHVHLYHNWFDNYIYAADTGEEDHGYREVNYRQDSAKFYGTEAEVSYHINDTYTVGLFGDYVRGKIEGENAPRIPAGRLGAKIESDFADGWSAVAEYYHVFNQDEFADYETETQGYNMVNVGLSYTNRIADKNSYRMYLKANNLLDDQVYSHTSFLSTIPQVGRNFSMGLEYRF